VLNTDSYYAPLLSFIDKVVSDGFLRPAHREMLVVDSDPERLLDRINKYVPPIVIKWIGGGER
jgi:predicted Rossmann-fold nucleotide-binding protein